MWLAVLLYYLLVPVGVALRVLGDPLRLRRRPGVSGWRPVRPRRASLANARRLY